MCQNMHDITFILNKIGYPDIFLTMTCNTQWPEIKKVLLPVRSVVDRSKLSVPVFRIKPCTPMAFVFDGHVCGEGEAHVRVVGFLN